MKFFVAVQLPNDFDSEADKEVTAKAIDDLNYEMIQAGIRIFVGGL